MNLTREKFRAMILYDFLAAFKTNKKVATEFGWPLHDKAPSLPTAYNQFNGINHAALYLTDDLHEGRPLRRRPKTTAGAALRQRLTKVSFLPADSN
ncbi:hypothetical protein EVAR_92188_1 [Eumeta japonica]|uniref:Uncharacterized protein n=1 Tax=Eumeta variegata TaxID=151549 RepID=A0A4C2A9N9_EUMVA|nr:hypothetical protein EVAR_92188_1 [Eumeta japonica]